jgi:ATP-dependent helicase/nuclease subunit A
MGVDIRMSNPIPKPIGSTWTDEQWQAITARGQDILVAAAAGSGKTAVLVERIIKRITESEDPVDVDRLLIVTFTNASAAEMKKRIGEAIEKELIHEPGSLYLRRQLSLLNRASISTLHSFCMEVLRRNYYKLDLDPKFRIADSTEADLLREEVLEELFEENYSHKDSVNFYKLVDCFSTDRTDQDLKNLVLKLYDFSRSHPFPEQWLKQMANQYGAEEGTEEADNEVFDYSFWTSDILEDIGLQLEGLFELLQQGMKITQEPAGPAPYAENLEQDLLQIKSLSRASKDSWSALYDAFQELNHGRLKACKGDEYDKSLQDKVKAIREQVKKHLNTLKEELFMRTLDDYVDDIKKMAPLMHTLANLITTFGQRYMKIKQQKALVDFSDLEHYCLDVLRDTDSSTERLIPSEAANEYRNKFVEVLVDEYQDTNQVQESILKLVTQGDSGKGNLFMVGDVKQSIYRFRLAEPGLFLSKYKQFSSTKSQNTGSQGIEKGLRIDLARNFRSRAEVLDGTNFIFKQIMNETVGEIKYDEEAELKLGADYPASNKMPIELLLIDRNMGNEEAEENGSFTREFADENRENEEEREGEGEGSSVDQENNALDQAELETVQLEARLMAQNIKELIGTDGRKPFQVYETKQKILRPIHYRDIVILLRSASSWAPTIVEEFKQQGIPVYAELSTGYFDATEVAVMMSLLKVIDNPFQDIPLASVLRSPIVGLSEDEMAEIRIQKKTGSYYEAFSSFLRECTEEVEYNQALLSKLTKFNGHLEKWRTRARQGSLSELIWQLYRETGYFDFVGGMPGGNQRQANLRALYDRAKQYESTTFRGLFRFLRFIERMQDRGSDLGTARALGEQEDVVRVMTIHKSKGLEFPVVFMAGLSKMFNRQDLNSKFLLHKELGIGSKFIDPTLRISYPMLPQLTIKKRMQMELLAEEMRVLYVALTRAKEKLFLIGTVKNGKKLLDQWSEHLTHPDWMLADYERANVKCYLDWIGPALIRHQHAQHLHQYESGGKASAGSNTAQAKEIYNHPSSWFITQIDPQSLLKVNTERDKLNQTVQEALKNAQVVPIISEHQSFVSSALSWSYKNSSAQEHMAKQSVTELKRQKEWLSDNDSIQMTERVRSTITNRPRFLQSSKLSAAERGTAMHMVMQHIPLSRVLSKKDIGQYIEHMVEKELITFEQANEIDLQGIADFLEGNLGERLLKADQVQREIPFSLGIPAREVFLDWQEYENETVLVQGVIDCLLVEDDGLVLIDYKTDAIRKRFKGGFEEAKPVMIERYQLQLTLYSRAIEQIWKKPLKEKYLYFFDGGHLLRMD